MKYIFESLGWRFFRRLLLRIKIKGFSASIRSFADKKSTFDEYSRVHGGAVIWHSHIGKYSYVTSCQILNAKVGNFCSIAAESIVGGAAPHPSFLLSTSPVFYSTSGQAGCSFAHKDLKFDDSLQPVILEDNVWVGMRAIIMPGITIGQGAIIGAGSIVTKNVEPYAIVAGTPAHLLRYRIGTELIPEIISKKLFQKNHEFYQKNIKIFTTDVGDEEFMSKLIDSE